MSVKHVLNLINDHNVRFADLRFTDMRGKEHHVTVPANIVNEIFFRDGKMFDGSSIKGFKYIQESDMILLPDATTAVLDPFTDHATINLRCDVHDPSTGKPYSRCPRSLAKRAEAYLKSTGIADACYFGPEPEFFIFDDVRWKNDMNYVMYAIDSTEGAWNCDKQFAEGNTGHRPSIKGGYFPVPPVDSAHDLRSAMCSHLEAMGQIFEAHHHEVATACQNEIATRANTLLNKADELQVFKYVLHNTAHQFGKTVTFMPKPLVGDNGNGMHCHQSLAKGGVNLFAGDVYAGLSELAMFYIGGIIHHARTLNAFTNATTNSYRRLVPGFEAPVMLAYSALNRSAAIRIPYAATSQGRRIEVRFPDAAINPYYGFTAMMMAGLDGIRHRMHPGEPINHDLYELPASEARKVPQVCYSLFQALEHLDRDREFLLHGGVFDNDLIDAYINIKYQEAVQVNMMTHPLEFELYYSL